MTTLNRRSLLSLAGAGALSLSVPVAQATPARAGAEAPPVNLRVWSAGAAGSFRNIYALETENGLVVIDAPLRKSDGAAVREWLEAVGKPVEGVLITHMHPDHNFGLTEMLRGSDAPIFATRAVAQAILEAEGGHQQFVPNFIGDAETERDRRFPDVLVESGETVTVDGVPFSVVDQGEAESMADSTWSTPALPNTLFSGDLVFHRVHSWVAQGATDRYLAVLNRFRREADPATLFLAGHGGMAPASVIPRQIAYLEAYRQAVREIAAGRPSLTEAEKQQLVQHMTAVEPSPMLAFGVAIGADAVARELATQ